MSGVLWDPSHRTRTLRDGAGRRLSGGVALLEPVTIGGVTQWVSMRGVRADAPLLLKVHGGPGQAEMATIGLNRLLEADFLVVEWDQRGAGKSAPAIEPASAMTLEQIVADAIELSEWLLHRFQRQHLTVLGHSWGSIVGMLAVHRRPDLFSAFVSTGQIADFAEGQIVAHRWALAEAARRSDTAATRILSALPEPPYPGPAGREAWMACVQRLFTFGAVWHRPQAFRPVRWMLSSPEHSLQEKLRFTRAAERSFELLYDDLIGTRLAEAVSSVDVPVLVAAGRHDRMAPPEVAQRFLDGLAAPQKVWTWFEQSAHFPQWEEPAAFHRFLLDAVLPATR